MTGKKIVATLLILPLLAISFYGCAPKDIPFESMDKQLSVLAGQPTPLQIRVMTSVPVSLVSGVAPEDEAKLRDIDYSRYLALLVSFGLGANERDNINSISQQGNTVYVRAEMLPWSDGEPSVCPYQIVRIKKAQMSLGDTTTFKLIDQFGKERTTVTQKVMP